MGRYQPSPPSTKELHDLTILSIFLTWTRLQDDVGGGFCGVLSLSESGNCSGLIRTSGISLLSKPLKNTRGFGLRDRYPQQKRQRNLESKENKLIYFFKMGHSRPLFIYFRLFNTADSKQIYIRKNSLPNSQFNTYSIYYIKH